MKLKILWILALAVGAAALATIATMRGDALGEHLPVLSLLLGVTALAASRPVRIPGMGIELSPTHPLILVALAELGPLAATLTGVAGVLGAAIGRARKPAAVRLVFNLGAVVLSAAVGAWAFLASGGYPHRALPELLLPLLAAATAYWAVNTGLVAMAISVEKCRPFFGTWGELMSWSVVGSGLAGPVVAIAVLATLKAGALWGLLIAVLPCWLLVRYYRSHAERFCLHASK